MRRKYRLKGNPHIGVRDLHLVCTVSEAARLFDVRPSTIYYHITNGNIAYRKINNQYIVSARSLIAYYKFVPPQLNPIQKIVNQ